MRLDDKTKQQIAAMLRFHVHQRYGNQTRAAAAWGISAAMVSGVLSGRKSATPAILKDAGIELEVTARWTEERVQEVREAWVQQSKMVGLAL